MIAHAPLSALPFKERVSGHPVIVFDGTCVLCSTFYRLVLRLDRDQVFRFATAQSEVGQALYTALNLSTTDFETNLVIADGTVFTHLDSVAAVMGALHWPWRWISVLRLLPGWIKKPTYRLIARNRFAILGRNETCLMPDPTEQALFVPGGW